MWLREGPRGEILLVWHRRAALRFSFWRELLLYMLTHTNIKKTSEAFKQETLGLRGQGFTRTKITVSLTKYSLGLYYQQLLSLLSLSLKWSWWAKKIAQPKRGTNKPPDFLPCCCASFAAAFLLSPQKKPTTKHQNPSVEFVIWNRKQKQFSGGEGDVSPDSVNHHQSKVYTIWGLSPEEHCFLFTLCDP